MSETITGIIPHVLQSTGGIGSKQFTVIMTDQRLIVAQLTSQMMSDALAQSRANKAGKGFLGGLLAGRVLTARDIVDYTDKYWSMNPEKIISESPSNFSVEVSGISAVKVEYIRKKSIGDDDSHIGFYVLTIESVYGVYSYIFDADPQDMDVLTKGLGNKLTGSGRSSPIKPLSIRKEANYLKSENRFCVNCGQQLPLDANFCPRCGKGIK